MECLGGYGGCNLSEVDEYCVKCKTSHLELQYYVNVQANDGKRKKQICFSCLYDLLERLEELSVPKKCSICGVEKPCTEGLSWKNNDYVMFMCSNCIFEKLTFLEATNSFESKRKNDK